MYHSSSISQKRRDEEKRKCCLENKITLIEINYQEWNEKSNSLQLFEILKSHKPELQLITNKTSISSSSSISSSYQQQNNNNNNNIIGKFILLQKWNPDQDPTGW
jgi:hypothetical protein